jgi:hypothetical protein
MVIPTNHVFFHDLQMNQKIFIVAGNYQQYKDWVKRNIDRLYQADPSKSISMSNFVYVSVEDTFRGHREVHGYFVGTFRDRPDIKDIVMRIRYINKIPDSNVLI